MRRVLVVVELTDGRHIVVNETRRVE